MPPPQNRQLRRDIKDQQPVSVVPPMDLKVYGPDEEIPIKKVECFNDLVAVLQFRVQSTLELPENSKFKSEGMVIGTGPGLPLSDGRRVSSQVSLGDVVAFYGNPITAMVPKSGLYVGHRIIIVSERALICKLTPLKFKVVSGVEAIDV